MTPERHLPRRKSKKDGAGRLQVLFHPADQSGLIVDVFDHILQNDEIESPLEIRFDIHLINIFRNNSKRTSRQFGLQQPVGVSHPRSIQFNPDSDTTFLQESLEYSTFPTADLQYPHARSDRQDAFDERQHVLSGIEQLDLKISVSIDVKFKQWKGFYGQVVSTVSNSMRRLEMMNS